MVLAVNTYGGLFRGDAKISFCEASSGRCVGRVGSGCDGKMMNVVRLEMN